MQPIHPLVYAGLGAGLVMYLLGLLLTYFFVTPRILRFLPGLLGLVAGLVLLYIDVDMKQGIWQGIAAFSLAMIGTCLIGLVLLMFQLFYQLSRTRGSA
ncbi:hypothetical protein [Paenibacillus campi]|uniref:hypothetical protein n=1 Tax=Paenibacillus campi TaxID=3106031 RepID=UPI002AFE9805|nr:MULTISPECIES: hypothetical protein [unclassified Paenibacillus]